MHAALLPRARFCAHCGSPIFGKPRFVINRDGPKDGPEVELCYGCGSPKFTCKQIWSRISKHAEHRPDRNLN